MKIERPFKIKLRRRLLAFCLAVIMVITGMPFQDGVLRAKADAPAFKEYSKGYTIGRIGSSGKAVECDLAGVTNAPAESTFEIKEVSMNGSDFSTVVKSTINRGKLSVVIPVLTVTGTLSVIAEVSAPPESEGADSVKKTVTLTFNVEDKAPYTQSSLSATLTYGSKLSEASVNAVFEDDLGNPVSGTIKWDTPEEVPECTGTKAYTCKFVPTQIGYYNETTGLSITPTVYKATPTVVTPTVADITYDAEKPLSTMKVTGGDAYWVVGGKQTKVAGTWKFANEKEIPTVNNTGYTMVFQPSVQNFNEVRVTVRFSVAKAVPKFKKKPTVSAITLGETLEMAQFKDYEVNCEGTLYWENKSLKPSISDSGKTKYNYYFMPRDTVNYVMLTDSLTVTVNKKLDPPNAPKEQPINVGLGCKTVADVGLPANWKWNEKDASKAIADKVGDTVVAIMEYTGSDKDNYANISRPVILSRSNCYHSAIEYRFSKTAKCEDHGYQGDKYCKACHQYIGNGELTEPLGHNYISSIQIKPTTTSPGKRTYRCTRIGCGAHYEESVLSTSDNSAGVITLRPALYENITTASVTLSQADVDTAIEGAVNSQVLVRVIPMSGGKTTAAQTIDVSFTKEVQDALVRRVIAKTVVNTPDMEISFSNAAMKAIMEKASGDATISMVKAEDINGRPCFDITLKKADGTAIEELGEEGVVIRIPYGKHLVNSKGEVSSSGNLEQTSKIKGIYKDSTGKTTIIEKSYYDEGSACVVIPTNHFSGYGVGYKVAEAVQSSQKTLRLKSKAQRSSVSLSWNKVSGATSYVVYGGRTNGAYKTIATVSGTSYTVKKLKKRASYRFYVKAVGSGTTIVQSKKIYVYTIGGKYGNQYNVKVSPKQVSLVVGKSKKLKVTYKKSGKLKKFTSYVRYQTSNPAVATVSSSGKVVAKGNGSCYIYIYTQNGYQTSVKITVSN